jgi:hypothetical protein
MSPRALIVALCACLVILAGDATLVLACGWWALVPHVACAAGVLWWLAWEEHDARG